MSHSTRHVTAGALALLAGLCLLLYPLLPVTERTVDYHWSSAEGSAELPLNPYRPAEALLQIQGEIPQGELIDTVRSDDPLVQEQALHVSREGDDLVARVGEADVRHPITPTGMFVGVDGDRLWISDDVRSVMPVEGDHRPAVDSLTLTPSAQSAGLTITADITADTRFDSRPTVVKLTVGVVAAVLLCVALVLFCPLRWPRPPTRWRFLPEDAAVVGATAFGVLAGGATDDDGFIRLIAGSDHHGGFLGNQVRWNNVPEAPFGWQYQVFSWIGAASWEPVFLRLVPWLVALAGWVLMRHLLLPRLLPRAGGWSRLVLAAAFLLGWLVYGNSLRPELLFAVGTAWVLWLTIRAHDQRSLSPMVAGCVVASFTIATGPTGLWAVTPMLVALPAMWPWIRRLPWTTWVPALVLALAGLGSSFLVMFADQTLGTVLAATSARTDYGPIYPVWMDPLRYYRLFMSFTTRQIVTYWAVIALGAALLIVGGRPIPRIAGVEARPVRWLVWTSLALVPVLTLSPTKLPHHFGALMLFGPLAAAIWTDVARTDAAARRLRPWTTGVGVGAVCAFAGLALHRANTWWKLGTLGQIADTKPLAFAGIPLWPVAVVAGALLGVIAWITHRNRPRAGRTWAVVLVIVQVAFTLGTYGNTAQAMIRRDPGDPDGPYTLGGAALGALRGEGCRLERSLTVESDVSAGAIATPGMTPDPALGLPVWEADGVASYDSGWLTIPEPARSGDLPIVVPVSGADAAHRVRVEYDHGKTKQLEPILKFLGTSDFSDIRVHPPAQATRFRIVAESDGPASWRRNILAGAPAPGPNGELVPFAVAAPRVPVVEPLLDVVGDATVATAWNLAFFTPCLTQPAEQSGTVEIPDYVLSDSERPGSIAFSAKNGGPFASALGLRTPVRVPIYAPGDHEESALNALDLIALTDEAPRRRVAPQQSERLRWGTTPGPAVALPGAGGT